MCRAAGRALLRLALRAQRQAGMLSSASGHSVLGVAAAAVLATMGMLPTLLLVEELMPMDTPLLSKNLAGAVLMCTGLLSQSSQHLNRQHVPPSDHCFAVLLR